MTTYRQAILQNLAAAQRLLQQLCDSNNADLALTASREMWQTASALRRLGGEIGAVPPETDITPIPIQPRPPRRSKRPSRPKRRAA